MYDTIAHKLVTTFTALSMCEAMLSTVHFAKADFFLYQAIQPVVRAELAQERVFIGTKNFCTLHFFSSHHSSGWVPMSSTKKVFVQEARAQYRTLAVRQNEYYPQVSQRVEEF
jgi:hypothetical protein